MNHDDGVLETWVHIVRRWWLTGAVAFTVILGLGVALLFLTRPVYRAEASLRLGEPPPPGGVTPSSGLLSFFQPGGDPFANDLELLASRSVAESVVEALALNATLDAPAGWHRDSLLAGITASRQTVEARYRVRWSDGALDVRQVAPEDSPIGRVAPRQSITFGGVSVAFHPYRAGMPESFEIRTVPFATATRVTRSAIDLEQPSREANVVEISYDDTDPGLATGVVRAVASEFTRIRTSLQERESSEAADSLRSVARSTERELRAAETALETLRRDGRLVAPEAQSRTLIDRQAALLSRRAEARAQLVALDQVLDRLDAVDDPGLAWTTLISYPAFLQNATLGAMLERLTDLRARRRHLAAVRAPDNAELRLLEEQIAYLDRSLQRLAAEVRVGLTEQLVVVDSQLRELDAMLSALPERATELTRAERDVRLLSEILVLTEQRLRQEELREALTYANVQVVDPPALRDRPIWPRKKLGLAVVGLLAAAAAFLAMGVRARVAPAPAPTTALQA